jgi:3-deoxy-manno-octulosonate cytidylyltransferase (CMP-KDO synthetase)
MTLRYKVVIPARYGSTRLPGKPLIEIAGKPMIVHVCERAQASGAEDIIVATDDERIFDTVKQLGIRAVMTSPHHQSGTERIAEVAEICGWADDNIIVNVQGDEPLIPSDIIRELAENLADQTCAGIATLAAKINAPEEIFNPNAVKVVIDKDGYALYFSRAPIPWYRDGSAKDVRQLCEKIDYYRHIGMYAYKVDFLARYCQWQASALEKVEALEQLRILWQGEKIAVNIIPESPPAGVDTVEDLARVEQLLMQ